MPTNCLLELAMRHPDAAEPQPKSVCAACREPSAGGKKSYASCVQIHLLRTIALFLFLLFVVQPIHGAERVPLHVERHAAGAPLTLGVPFPQGALDSPDYVRVVDAGGKEIVFQVTEVSTWEPADESIKWVWIFFFAGADTEYFVEFGEDVRREPTPGPKIEIINRQRENGFTQVTTGPLRFVVKKGEGGFLSEVFLDSDSDGFEEDDRLAGGVDGRGSFLDLVDENGIDPSKAVVHRMVVEKGSGPLTAIIRVDGEYRYGRENHYSAPFVTHIRMYPRNSRFSFGFKY